MTYFFHHGKIHVILNTLQKLEENDYDSIGNANMVVNTLCETLGVTRNKLARILKHFVYDGYRNFTFQDSSCTVKLTLRFNFLSYNS